MDARKTDQQIYDESIGEAIVALRRAVVARFRITPAVVPGEHADLVLDHARKAVDMAADDCRRFVKASEDAAGAGAVQRAGEYLANKLDS